MRLWILPILSFAASCNFQSDSFNQIWHLKHTVFGANKPSSHSDVLTLDTRDLVAIQDKSLNNRHLIANHFGLPITGCTPKPPLIFSKIIRTGTEFPCPINMVRISRLVRSSNGILTTSRWVSEGTHRGADWLTMNTAFHLKNIPGLLLFGRDLHNTNQLNKYTENELF